MSGASFAEGLTFDDVLLVPRRSDVMPRDVNLATRFSRSVPLSIPIASAAMDTVTEEKLAVALAREGGIGVIHRNLPIEGQIREVDKVKRSANGIILDPVTLSPRATIREAREIMTRFNISGLPVLEGKTVVGILTRRDCRFQTSDDTPVGAIMTKENLVTAPPGTKLEDARVILFRHKVEKLILVDKENRLQGLITMKDLNMLAAFPSSATDARGRLRVAAAIGVMDYERADGLVKAGVDVLVVDTAHGHSSNVVDTVKELKRRFAVDVVAGNVATAEGARFVEAGATASRSGSTGSICTTRICRRGRAAADRGDEVASLKKKNAADRGRRCAFRATSQGVAAGASTVMLGSLFAGLGESPGEVISTRAACSSVRGMGSLGDAPAARSAGRRHRDRRSARGIEGMVPFGASSPFTYHPIGGVRAGMGWRRGDDRRPVGARALHPHHERGHEGEPPARRHDHQGVAELLPRRVRLRRS
jgi:IMP dehydrogenase